MVAPLNSRNVLDFCLLWDKTLLPFIRSSFSEAFFSGFVVGIGIKYLLSKLLPEILKHVSNSGNT